MGRTRSRNYLASAIENAKDCALNFLDEIVESLLEGGEASDDLTNDYPDGDSYHHESHVDKDYTLTEAADLLDELSDWEETDSGLWQGLEPRRAVTCQAAFTYGNAVYHFWRELVGEINDSEDIREFLQVREDAEQDGEDVKEILSGLVCDLIKEWGAEP